MEIHKTPVNMAGAERRGAARRRYYKEGRILSRAHAFSRECLVWEVSANGAKLSLDSSADVPSEFYFFIPSENVVAKARVAWRAPGRMGINFQEPLVDRELHPEWQTKEAKPAKESEAAIQSNAAKAPASA